MADSPDKNVLDEKGDDKMLDKEEKQFLENDACLEKGANDSNRRETPTKRTLKERVKQKCSCLSLTWRGLLIFFVLCVLLFIFLIVIIVLAVHVDCWGGFSSSVCQKPECLRIGADLVEKLNLSATPCDDMFSFSCGGWVDKHKYNNREYQDILDSRGKYNTEAELVRLYHDRLRKTLNTLPYITNVASVLWKMKSFYDSCVNIDNIEAAGGEPLKRILNRLNGWDVIGQWTVSAWDFKRVLIQLHGTYGVYPFFKPAVQLDTLLADKTILKLEPSGLGLPERSYYFRNRDDKVIQAYKHMLRDSAVLLGATGPAANTFADDTFHFEKRIAEIYPEEDSANRFGPQQHPTVGELRSWLPLVSWFDHLNMVFPSSNIRENTRVVANKTYLTHVSRIISNSDDRALNNYMLWKVVHQYAPYLSNTFQQVLDNFQHALTGSTLPLDRWEFCIQETEKVFPLAITSLYVHDKEYDLHVLGNVTNMFNTIIDTFIDRIEDYSWMDEKSRDFTIEKVRLLQLHVSVPQPVNSSQMVLHYSQLNILKPDFFQNILRAVEFRNHLSVTWLQNASAFLWDQPEDCSDRTPFVVPAKHKLVLSPILTHVPLYGVYQPSSVNFGALGSLIGRTLIHEFEDADEYDKYWRQHTNYHHHRNWDDRENYWAKLEFTPKWWTNYTLERYEKHQNCVATEYYKYEMRDVEVDGHSRKADIRVDGNRTVDQNVADLGGAILAYHAYKSWAWKHGEDKRLPAIHDKSQTQMFFFGYAQSFCSVERPQSLVNELQITRFSPNILRVNGVLSHMREFAWVFGCSYYADMNEPEKCDAW